MMNPSDRRPATAVSVILPTYNRLWVLPRAIESVLEQSFQNWDLWIIDDGSTDGTADWIRHKYAQDFKSGRMHLLSTQNRGVSAARNLGVAQSRGQWLAFLDSDDQWLPEKLEKQLLLSKRWPHSPLIHGEELWVRRGIRVNPRLKHQKTGGRVFSRCLPLCCISPSTAMVRRQVLEEVGAFREDFPVCEDYELWLRICSLYEVGFVEEPIIIKYGGHDDQLSRRHIAMDYWRIKALEPYLGSSVISRDERRQVAAVMLEKSRILLNGYRKHNNLERYHEVEEWFERARASQLPM